MKSSTGVKTAEKPAPHSREEIVAALYGLFRCAGYEGVSLADISAATGLGKSSLYHHFPEGKPDMAEAVGAFALQSMRANVFTPLRAEGAIRAKVEAMLATVDAVYEGGAAPCLVASMLPSGAASTTMGAIIAEWIDALAAALKAAGVKSKEARARAVAAIVAIEGSLIVARATGEKAVFRDALGAVRGALLAGT